MCIISMKSFKLNVYCIKTNLEFLPLFSVWVVLVMFELIGDWFPPTLTIVIPPDIWFTWDL